MTTKNVGISDFQKEMRYAAVLIVLGLAIYFVRALARGEWPFRASLARARPGGRV